jgi:hypothetical protein
MSKLFVKSASHLRIVLWAAMVLLTTFAIGVGIYAINTLNSYAQEVNATVTESKNSEEVTADIRKRYAVVEELKQAAERAEKVVAERNEYLYQNTAISDLSTMASASGVTILSYTFVNDSGGTEVVTPQEQATSPETAPARLEGAAPATPSASSDAKPTALTIAFEQPLGYRNLLDFIHRVEQNITRMQIESVSISRDEEGAVTSEGLTLEVYIK